MQEEVLRLVLLALEDGSALSRKVLVMFVVQRLEPHFPQASKTSIGHVVQLLYRASCFKGDSKFIHLFSPSFDIRLLLVVTAATARWRPPTLTATNRLNGPVSFELCIQFKSIDPIVLDDSSFCWCWSVHTRLTD